MDPSYEELAWLRAHEPGLKPPTRHVSPRDIERDRRVRRHLARTLRRMANRLDG